MWVSHVMHVQHRWLALGLHSHTAWWPIIVLVFFSSMYVYISINRKEGGRREEEGEMREGGRRKEGGREEGGREE